MTNDKQVEVWRKDFEQGYTGDRDSFLRHPAFTNTYWFEKVQLHWEGFLLAKRNQPVIELPYPDHGDGFRYWAENEVDDAITAAGYSYRVKE